jgi:YXWGXW repeat-containing protein
MRIARLIFSLLLAVVILAIPVQSRAQVAVGISVRIGPPVLPVYAQPICPGPGYIWVPGYWAYGDDGYFWVPGTWVIAPEPGLLWTPGYWGWNDGFYIWHAGYWGPVVGFYGGINYGFGYPGIGFFGGYWRGGSYYYNRSVTNVNVTVVHNVYEKTVINERTVNRVSFNGGSGGINARPNHAELAAEHERHVPMTAEQSRHFEAARGDRSFLASVNHGHPEVAATPRPGEFRGRGEEHGRGATINRPPENRGEFNRADRVRENNGRNRDDRPPSARSSHGDFSNSRLDEKHQREYDKMQRQQDAERQKMQRQHDQEQQKLSRQNANQQRQDQLQRHQQQQMEQMNRRHDQQTQKMQQRQQREVQKQEGKPQKNNRPSDHQR